MDLNNFTSESCGVPSNPGLASYLWLSCTCEHNNWPQTKKELGGTAPGDSKILDEPFDFKAGKFWKKFPILVDISGLTDTLEGELGGQGFMNDVNFEIKGTDAEKLEFADCLVANSGCLVAMVKERGGLHRVVGNLEVPAIIESAVISTGAKNADKKVGAYVLKAMTGLTAPIYNVTAVNIIQEA